MEAANRHREQEMETQRVNQKLAADSLKRDKQTKVDSNTFKVMVVLVMLLVSFVAFHASFQFKERVCGNDLPFDRFLLPFFVIFAIDSLNLLLLAFTYLCASEEMRHSGRLLYFGYFLLFLSLCGKTYVWGRFWFGEKTEEAYVTVGQDQFFEQDDTPQPEPSMVHRLGAELRKSIVPGGG